MKKILVIDDDIDILDSLGSILRLSGFEVFTSHHAEQIAQLIRTIEPDLILLDIMLSGFDGRTICYILKSNARYQSLPIIIFSASDISREEVLATGANEFVAKPFGMDLLLGHIHRLLQSEDPVIL
jgi:DNA-binding response OmpR family regulator